MPEPIVIQKATDSVTSPSAIADPQRQRIAERAVLEHVLGLIEDRRFVIPTSFGPRPTASLQRTIHRWDRALAFKRRMAELDIADFDLQDNLPRGVGFDVALSRQVLLAFNQPMAHVRFASLPPIDALIRGDVPTPMDAETIRRTVADLPAPGAGSTSPSGAFGGPMTLILFAGGGFSDDARRVAREFVEGPPTILIEPNAAGGYDVTGPPGSEFLCELLDPERYPERRNRVFQALDERDVELLTGAVPLDAVAEATKLPLSLVEEVAREWAERQAATGGGALRVKKIGGVPMVYRDSSVATSGMNGLDVSGGRTTMPVMDRIRRLFGGSVSPQRKIAELAEQRAALSRQRERVYEEMAKLEDREQELRNAFMADETAGARRRITSQLYQLQKDIERRRQTVGMLNQQINVVGTHLHNLEIARTGVGKLPKSEEIAEDAAKAEEVLAELQASNELADEISGHVAAAGMSDEEERLFAELTAAAEAHKEIRPTSDEPAFAREIPVAPKREAAKGVSGGVEEHAAQVEPGAAEAQDEILEPKRAEPEAG